VVGFVGAVIMVAVLLDAKELQMALYSALMSYLGRGLGRCGCCEHFGGRAMRPG